MVDEAGDRRVFEIEHPHIGAADLGGSTARSERRSSGAHQKGVGAGIRADAPTGFLNFSDEPTDAAKGGHTSQTTRVDELGSRQPSLADVLAHIEADNKLTPV